MLTPGPLINRIVPLLVAEPSAGAAPAPQTTVLLISLLGAAVIGAALWSFAQRRRRCRAVAARVAQRGLTAASAGFVGRFACEDGPQAADALLSEPEALRRRLGRLLREARDDGAAARLAADAALLLTELHGAVPFPGAPAPFTRLRVLDPLDPREPSVLAWVVAVDQRSVMLVSRAPCRWPARRALRLQPDGEPRPGETFDAQLLLRPAFPHYEWVLTHRLVDVVSEHRHVARVPCRLPAELLPDDGDAPKLRERLLREQPFDHQELATSGAWARRREATVLDLSAEGARLLLRHEVAPRQRMHLLLRRPDGAVAALPLAEVVASSVEPDGTWRASVRFVTVRMRERVRLAEFVGGLVKVREPVQSPRT